MTDLLCIGDSWASVKSGKEWPALLGVPEHLRQGVGNSWASEWAAVGNEMLARAVATPCPRVFISLGGVDVGNGARLDVTMRHLRTVADCFRDRKLYVVQYDACPWTNFKFWWGARKLNDAIAWTLSEATLCRLDTVLRGKADFASDGFHPSDQGHRKIAAYMKGLLA